jgi:hypothetical protein
MTPSRRLSRWSEISYLLHQCDANDLGAVMAGDVACASAKHNSIKQPQNHLSEITWITREKAELYILRHTQTLYAAGSVHGLSPESYGL